MDEKDLSILYRPQTNIERNYRSEGTVLHELPDNRTEEEKQQPSVPEIPDEIEKGIQQATEAGEKLWRIRRITEVFPERAKPTVDDLLDTVIVWTGVTVDRLNKVKEEEPSADERHEIPGETYTEPDHVEDDWPIMTSSGFIFDVIKNKDSWDLAYDQYLLESAAIQEDFAEEYNNVMEGYVYQLVSAMDEVGLDAPEYLNYAYEGDTVTGVPVNYMHLNDIIVKNQDIVNEYEDIFRKTHDLYTTDAILTAWDTASQKRIRYLKEKYKPETAGTYIEMYDKNYLADSRNEMEQRYIQSRTNVYKLLHSAAQISKEMLDTQLKLAISKCSLLSKEVNIFAKKEYEDTAQNTTTGSESVKSGNTGNATTAKSNTGLADITVNGGWGSAIGQGLNNTTASAQQKNKEAAAGTGSQTKTK